MKVSGSHIEKVSTWTNMGYEASEQATIQSTVEKLSKEGKHVINIIHGDKTMIGGDYTKTITFLWETDTEDPVYKALMEKEAEMKRLGREVGRQKDLLISENTKMKNISQEIADIEKRIKTAESNDLYTEKDIKEMDNEKIMNKLGVSVCVACLGLFFLMVGILLKGEGAVSVFQIIGSVIAFLISGCILFNMFTVMKDNKKTRLDRMNIKNEPIIKDQQNINKLKLELDEKRNQLKECQKNRSELLAVVERKQAELEKFEYE